MTSPCPVEGAPRAWTWLVGETDHPTRAICLEAYAPSRVESFKRHHHHRFYVMSTQPGMNYLNRPMPKETARQIEMNIKRQANRPTPQGSRAARRAATPVSDVNAILRRVSEYHAVGVDYLIRPPNRGKALTTARHHAVYLLHKELGLSQPHIAKLLGYSDHTTVRHVLGKTLDVILGFGRSDEEADKEADGDGSRP